MPIAAAVRPLCDALQDSTSGVSAVYDITGAASTPSTANALATVTGTFAWTDGGVAKSLAIAGLALAAIANYIQGTMIMSVDQGTNITFSDTITGTAGVFIVRIVVTQVGSGT